MKLLGTIEWTNLKLKEKIKEEEYNRLNQLNYGSMVSNQKSRSTYQPQGQFGIKV